MLFPLFLSIITIERLTFYYHDDAYINYVKEYFPHTNIIWHPPGGGISGKKDISDLFIKTRVYDLTFIGTYTDYRKILENSMNTRPDWYEMINSFFKFLISNPKMSITVAIKDFISSNRLDIEHNEVPSLLEILYPAENAARSYYREKIIKHVLDNGIHIDVFSETWHNAPYAKHPCISIHKDIGYRDSMLIMQKSKLSLNIFPGITPQ